jgi:hypothetical protein
MSIRIGRTATITFNRTGNFRVTSEYRPGNSWYVSSTYTGGTSNGQLATPWKTIQNVRSAIDNNTIKQGDTVYFKRGDTFTGTFNFYSKIGPYTFSAYGTGNKPKFICTGTTMSQLFDIQGSSYLTFDNFEVIDNTLSPTDRSQLAKIKVAFRVQIGSSNITIQNCDISLVGIAAIFTETTSTNTFTGCNVSNLRMIVNDGSADNDYGANGLTVYSSNNIITNNIFSGCWAPSIDYGYDGGGVEFFEEGVPIENNLIAYNTFYDNNGTFEFGSSTDGIANNPIRNNIIAYNKIINCSSVLYINNSGQFKTSVSNLQLYNNVILQTTASRSGNKRMFGMATTEATTNIITFKNNIFFLSNTGSLVATSSLFSSNNLVNSNNVYTLFNGSKVGFTTGSTDFFSTGSYTVYWTDVTNINPISWSYSPSASSILINNGTNVNQTLDFNGNTVSTPPEIGILEYI